MTSAFRVVQRQQIERHLNWRGLHITVVKQNPAPSTFGPAKAMASFARKRSGIPVTTCS